jgi:carboxyl-terminal processing protease
VSIGKRKWIAAAAAVALTLTVSVSAAFALDTTDQAFERIRVVYEVVSTWHKDGADLDKFTSGAIKGGLEALGDQYTQYFTPDDYKSFMDSLNGSFSGIGAYLEQVGDYVVISAPIKNSPAAKADLQAGDRIVEANGTNLVGATADKAVEIIRGEPGTQVTLKIERPSANRTFTVTITRETISVPEVDSKLLEPGVGYIELSSFGDDAAKDFYKAMESLKAQGAKAVVLDLRNNGGGYVDAALAVASAWTPLNKPVAWEVRKNSKTSLDSKGYTVTMPVVTLVNKGTASASEIVAGAIQDYKGGPLVSEQTFGKGTVQQWIQLQNGSALKLTIAKWLTPDKHWIHHVGIVPDVPVTTPADAGPTNDPVLDKAVELLTKASAALPDALPRAA